MANERKVRTYKQKSISAVILIAVLCILLYLTIQLSQGSASRVSTQRTQKITDIEYGYHTGYVFRDESVITADGELVEHLVSNGEKVGAGQTYANIYSTSSDSSDGLGAVQDLLTSLSDRIYILENSVNSQMSVSELSKINEELSRAYYAYVDAVSNGDIGSAADIGDRLLSYLVAYSTVTGGSAPSDVANGLRAEKDELLSSYGQPTASLSSDSSFNLFRSTDGYESIFSSSVIDTLTPSALTELLNSEPQSYGGKTVGRAVNTSKWYFVIPANEAEYLKYTVGSFYDVTFLDGSDSEISMRLEEIRVDEADTDCAFLLFSSFDLSVSGEMAREQSVRVRLGSCTGYSIPTESLKTVNGENGVYILIGNTVEFRRVTVIIEGNGYYVVNTYEADWNEVVEHSTPYLNVNDLIITSGNDLYSGKRLD